MKTNLSLLGPALLVSSLGLVACDSATATNDKVATEVKPAAVVTQEAVQEAPKVAVEKVAEKATTASADAPATEVVKKAEVASTAATQSSAEATPVQAVVKAPEFKEGKHYFEIFPTMQTDAVGGKVEVVELMWLGCPHCYTLEPTIAQYKKNLPDYVEFKQVPAMLNPRWIADAKTFYTAQLLDPKGEKKLVEKVFHAIHVQKRRKMGDPEVAKSFLVQHGVSEADFDNAAKSMALKTLLSRAQQISADSQAQSVPSIIINGKYRTSPYAAGNEQKLLQVVDMLTKRELGNK